MEKHVFDPFLTDFLSQNSPFSRHFVSVEWPKWLAMGSKRAHFICLGTPNGLGSFLEKHIFDPFLVPKQPTHFSRHFVPLEGPKWLVKGSKGAHFTCLGTPNGLGYLLEKHIFDPFFVPQQPIFKALWEFGRAKMGHHELKTRQKYLFWHSVWSKIIFEKGQFFFGTRWTLLTHFGTHLFGLPLAACRSPMGLDTGVWALVKAILRGGNHQKWVVAGGLGALEFAF